ncbi:MAG: hypothetical protein HYV75_01880 [Opitutae bacterium]|nr:hypothetical protein [Opitutae bacterium]
MFFNTPKRATLARGWWILVIAGGLVVSAQARPVYLDTPMEGGEKSPGLVLAGRQIALVLALTSAATEQPELAADLFATGGTLAAPLFSNRSLTLSRIGTPGAGLQRFRFLLEIPPAEKTQSLVLRLRVRNDPTGAWLPLPVVTLEARPVTWKASLRRFAQRHACGWLAGGEKLNGVFRAAETAVTEMAGDGPAPRVAFVEAADGPLSLPTPPDTFWIVFKHGASADLTFSRPLPGGPLVLTVEASVLNRLETDAAAQDLFERALSAVQAILASSESPPSQP